MGQSRTGTPGGPPAAGASFPGQAGTLLHPCLLSCCLSVSPSCGQPHWHQLLRAPLPSPPPPWRVTSSSPCCHPFSLPPPMVPQVTSRRPPLFSVGTPSGACPRGCPHCATFPRWVAAACCTPSRAGPVGIVGIPGPDPPGSGKALCSTGHAPPLRARDWLPRVTCGAPPPWERSWTWGRGSPRGGGALRLRGCR